jgi:hypothetical protein
MQCVAVLLVAVLLCMIHNAAAPQHAIQYARTAKENAKYILKNAATQPHNAFFLFFCACCVGCCVAYCIT